MANQFKPNGKAIKALLLGPEVHAELKRRAEAIAAAAGPGMVVGEENDSSDRARISVRTGTWEAKKAQNQNRALTSAISAGRTG